MGWPRLKKSTMPNDIPLYPDVSAVDAVRAFLRIPPAALNEYFRQQNGNSKQRRNRGEGKIEYSMKEDDGSLVYIVHIEEGKYMVFVPTRDTEDDGDTLVYKWVSEADLESMNKGNVTNRKSRRGRSNRKTNRKTNRRRKQRHSTRRN